MNRVEVLEIVTELIKDLFDNEDLSIGEDTTAADVDGWDSIQQIALIDMIEKKFGIHFSIDEIVSMANVGEIIDKIEKKLV